MRAETVVSIAEHHQTIKRVFAEVCDLDPEARRKRLERSSQAVRLAVERLLEHDREESLFDSHWRREEFGEGESVLPKDEWIGKTVHWYRIMERIGEGGMGVVYLAEDTRLRRPVAVKFLASHLIRDPRQRRRFMREAETAAALDHPSICKILDVGELDGWPFTVSTYIAGDSLEAAIQCRSLSVGTALEYAIQLAEALKTAHDRGILHRDLKPANVLLAEYPDGNSRAILIDFGLAHMDGRSELTAPGVVIGTAQYVCPEALQGRPLGKQADIWSLGVMIYEMLTGRAPFDASNRERLFYLILNEKPAPPTNLNAVLPAELDRVLGRALNRNLDDRYQDVGSLLEELRAIKNSLTGARSSSRPKRINGARNCVPIGRYTARSRHQI